MRGVYGKGQMKTDAELLRDYVRDRCQDAFAELVRRHIDLVYATAHRRTGNAELARDVTQTVFTALARKAQSLSPHIILAGWLHRASHFAAGKLIRNEVRRHTREQEAATIMESNASDEVPWKQIAPLLDEAVNALDDVDRHAVLLRFFEKKNLQAVGAELGISDDAAQKRVSRAVDKLREFFRRRGANITVAGLAALLSNASSQAVPVGLNALITTSALGATAASVPWLANVLVSTQGKIAAGIIAAAVVGTPLLLQQKTIDQLTQRNEYLEQRPSKLLAERQRVDYDELEGLRKEHLELLKLREETSVLRNQASLLQAAIVERDAFSNEVTNRAEENAGLTARLRKSLEASWVFERDQWQDQGQNDPMSAFQTMLWAWANENAAALNETVSFPREAITQEERERFIKSITPREQLPATRATRVKVFWMESDKEKTQASLVALTESQFVDRPIETREYLVRWELVNVNGLWKVTGRNYL